MSRRLDYIVTKDVSQEPILKQGIDRSLIPVKQLAIVIRIFQHNTSSKIREAYKEDLLAKELRKN